MAFLVCCCWSYPRRQALPFGYPGCALLHGSKDRVDRQRAQASHIQGWPTAIFFARLTGKPSKHSVMLWLRRNPVDAERCPHDGQSRDALADGNVQRRRVTAYKEIGLRQEG